MSVITKEVDERRNCLLAKCRAKSEYLREATLRVNLERQLARITEENSLYKDAVSSLLASVNELLRPDYPAFIFLREHLQDTKEVVGVSYCLTDDVMNLWIVIDEENFEVEMKIAETLRELLSLFRNLRFDFMVIPKYETPLESLIPDDARMLYSRT